MAIEIERKFLVSNSTWRASAPAGTAYRQGYLCADPTRTVRVRIAGEKAFLTIKGKSAGAARAEFEYPIPPADALALLQLCTGPLVEKTRYKIPHAGHLWEIDVFEGANAPLVLAEVELTAENETVALPPWAGQEVTSDHRYQNSNLAARPFSSW